MESKKIECQANFNFVESTNPLSTKASSRGQNYLNSKILDAFYEIEGTKSRGLTPKHQRINTTGDAAF